jgi:hypothetical protein
LGQIVAIGLFGAHGRQAAEGLLTELAPRPADAGAGPVPDGRVAFLLRWEQV